MRRPATKDLYEISLLALLWLPAWLLPEAAWPRLSALLARLSLVVRRAEYEALEQDLSEALAGAGVRCAPRVLIRQLMAANFERYMQVLREYAPWGWHPRIDVQGLEHLLQARQQGLGVLLYVYPTIHYYLVAKKGLHAAGIRTVHLSRVGHGFSNTAFGIRYLNPIMTRVEDRYLAQRFTLTTDASVRSIRPLIQALKRGRMISITANTEGRCHEIPFLGGGLRLARGAASLGLANGAPVVPVTVVRRSPGHYLVNVWPSLPWPDETLSADAREQALLEAYGRVLEDVVRRHPADWPEWLNRSRWHPERGSR